MSDLPPGPLTVNQFDSVYDATGRFVASLDGYRTLVELLIRAEREADPTPIDVEWLVSIGGELVCDHEFRTIVEFFIDGWERFSVVFPGGGMTPCVDAVKNRKYSEVHGVDIPTRGTFRTAMRVLGIKIEEPNP